MLSLGKVSGLASLICLKSPISGTAIVVRALMRIPLNGPWVGPAGMERIAFDRRLQGVAWHTLVANQRR